MISMRIAALQILLALALLMPAPAFASSTLDSSGGGWDDGAARQERHRVTTSTKSGHDGGDVLKAVAWYIPNRVNDLLDTLHLSGSFGPPGAANIRFTRNLWWGVTELNVHRLGLIGERTSFYEKEILHDECGFNLFNVWVCGCTPRPPLEVGVDAHMGLGVRAAIDFDTFGDFLAGFFFCDPDDDDYGPKLGRKTKTEYRRTEPAVWKTDRDEDDDYGRGAAK